MGQQFASPRAISPSLLQSSQLSASQWRSHLGGYWGHEVPPVTALQSCAAELRRQLASASHVKVPGEMHAKQAKGVALSTGGESLALLSVSEEPRQSPDIKAAPGVLPGVGVSPPDSACLAAAHCKVLLP